MINYLMDYSYALNEDFERIFIMIECGSTPLQVKVLETGLNVLSKDCLGGDQYLDIKVKCMDNNKIFYTQSRFLKYKLKEQELAQQAKEKIMKSVKQMMKDGELKEGMKLKLKPLSKCDEDQSPRIVSTMKEWFGKEVTVDTFPEVNGWVRINEYSLSWHSDWFEDVEIKEERIKIGSKIKRICSSVEEGEIYTLKSYLDTNCYDETPWITLEEIKGEYCIMGFELVEEDTLKVSLEKSILMWQEMYDKDCSEEKAIQNLSPNEEPLYECFLCDCLRGERDSTSKCKKCLKWSEDRYYDGIAFCNNPDSPFRIWGDYKTKENTLNVLNFLKHEYIRLYGEKEFQEKNKELYDFFKKEKVLEMYWDNVINLRSNLSGLIKTTNRTIIGSFRWRDSKEGVDFWSELDNKWCDRNETLKEIKKDYYHFKDTEINFNQLCNDALEDDTSSFIVVGKEKAFAGLIQSGKKVGVPMVYEDFMKSGNIINFVPELPYGIFEISLDKVDIWKEKLSQYSKDFKAWREDLNSEIKDRDRKDNIKRKDLKSFKVYQF